MNISESSVADAYWNQRLVLANERERILALCEAVNCSGNLLPFQWAQLMAFALEFSPDLILELGRGMGNSTCAFTEAANLLPPGKCRVISVCLDGSWKQTASRVSAIVPAVWFEPLQIVVGNILTFEFKAALNGYERILVFWDAHGFDVAECVLGRILPLLAGRTHAVAMHDLCDARYYRPPFHEYGGHGLWKGTDMSGPRLRIGDIDSAVEQAVAIVDFVTRNRLSLFSADHSIYTGIAADPARVAEMQRLLGDQLFSLLAHWRWFSLNEHPEPYTFPSFEWWAEGRKWKSRIRRRIKAAAKILLNRYPAERVLD